MALGALLAGMAMASTGLYTVHALTYPVGAFSGASHGACNGVLLPAVLDFVAPVRPEETRRLCELLGSRQARVGDAVREFLAGLGAPVWLEELGFERDRIEAAAEIACGIRRLMQGSPRPTGRGDLAAILRAACRGGA
jgi:alcohol dehydrogenase class IV